MLERRPHPTDRRVRTLWLTRKGEALVCQVLAITAEVHAEALTGIPDADRECLLDLLEVHPHEPRRRYAPRGFAGGVSVHPGTA